MKICVCMNVDLSVLVLNNNVCKLNASTNLFENRFINKKYTLIGRTFSLQMENYSRVWVTLQTV